MPRKRLISPEFFKHGELYDAELASGLPLRLAFAGLWTVTDRSGRFEWKPRELKTDVLPHDVLEFSDVLDALELHSFVTSYTVDGKRYGLISSFERWQSFHHREPGSRLPAPGQHRTEPVHHPSLNGAGTVQGRSQPEAKPGPRPRLDTDAPVPSRTVAVTVTGTVTGTDVRSLSCDELNSTSFAATWSQYPKRSGGNSRHDAEKAWNARSKSGVPGQAMLDGTLRYRRYCEAVGKIGTEYVMQGARFYGPALAYDEPWDLPADDDPMPPMYGKDGSDYTPEWVAWNTRQSGVAP